MSAISRLRRLPYRVGRRFGSADHSRFFGCDLENLSGVPCPEGLVAVQLAERDLLGYFGEENCLDDTHVCWLRDEVAICYAVLDGTTLAGFAWIGFGDVPGELNHNGHPDTQLPVFLPANMGFVSHVFVLPAYRGQRLYAALLSFAAESLPALGIDKLVLTTECTNTSALCSVRRMGFETLGEAWIMKLGPFCTVGYPPQPFFGGVRTGRFAGDPHERSNG